MTTDFYTAVKERRSIYALSKQSPISDARIQEIVEEAVLHIPTSFNSQTTRAVVLVGAAHDKLWDITTETLRAVVPADAFEPTQQKMDMFKAAYGSVLFFSDDAIVEGLQQQFSSYADNFPIWANQSSGMLQFAVWTAFGIEGLGASLQHYNPLIDEKVKAEWNIPASWKLTAQMPFGTPVAPAGEKQFAPIADRVKFYN